LMLATWVATAALLGVVAGWTGVAIWGGYNVAIWILDAGRESLKRGEYE
jgi:hypothetical protein